MPLDQRHGQLGERAAKKHLQKRGLKFLTANFRSDRGEIDLVFRDDDCLVFVEVKTRSGRGLVAPGGGGQRRQAAPLLTRCAFDYLRLLKNPPIKIRFDVVEVLLEDGSWPKCGTCPNTFTLSAPYRYG